MTDISNQEKTMPAEPEDAPHEDSLVRDARARDRALGPGSSNLDVDTADRRILLMMLDQTDTELDEALAEVSRLEKELAAATRTTASYTRYEPGYDDVSLKPALWCLDCTEDDNYQADVRQVWVQPDEGTDEPTLADWMAVADGHEAKCHTAAKDRHELVRG
jgi:hypothetical protein